MMNQPTVSVNKLAESIVSKAARKRKIIKDRKYPDPDFNIGMYHREAEDAIQAYIADGCLDTGGIDRTLGVLNQQAPSKIGTIRRITANIATLERFLEMLDDIDLKGAEPFAGDRNPPKLTIQNVSVSVRPEIILRGLGPKKRKCVGAIKLHISSSDNFDAEAAGYVSAIVQEYCKLHVAAGDELVHAEYCQVLDVGNGSVHPGVKATSQRMKDIEAECQNIFGLWPTI